MFICLNTMMHSIHNFLNDGLLQSFPPWKSQTIELRCVFCIRCQNSGLNNFRICSTVFKNRLRKNHHFCREGGCFGLASCLSGVALLSESRMLLHS